MGSLALFQLASTLVFGIVSARIFGPSLLAEFALASILVRFPSLLVRWSGPTYFLISSADLDARWVRRELKRLWAFTFALSIGLLAYGILAGDIVSAYCSTLLAISSANAHAQIRLQRARRLRTSGVRLESALSLTVAGFNMLLLLFLLSTPSVFLLFIYQSLSAVCALLVAVWFEREAKEEGQSESENTASSPWRLKGSARRVRTVNTLNEVLTVGRINAIQIAVASAFTPQDVAGFWKMTGVIGGPVETVINRQIMFLRGRALTGVHEGQPRSAGKVPLRPRLVAGALTAIVTASWFLADDVVVLVLGADWRPYASLAFPTLLSTILGSGCWWIGLVVVQLGHGKFRLISQIVSIVLCLMLALIVQYAQVDLSTFVWCFVAVLLVEMMLLLVMANRHPSWTRMLFE